MVRKELTLHEIRQIGFDALLERLGPAGTIAFIQQYDRGHGDYTKDRHRWLDGETVEGVVRDIENRRAKS